MEYNVKQYIENLEYLFKQFEFLQAEEFYNCHLKYISNCEYLELYNKYTEIYKIKLIKKAELGVDEFRKYAYCDNEELSYFAENLDDIVSSLSKFNFMEADNFYEDYKEMGIIYEDYIKIKAAYILKYFKQILPNVQLDTEKAIAIADFNKYQLLDARAGSGKTTTICLRTKFLIEKYGIKPSEILIFAFNHNVPEKINIDLSEKYDIKDFSNAMTFHKFAGTITNGRVNENTIKENIRIAINTILSNEDTYNKLYEFYKYPLLLDDTFQPNLSDEEFYYSRKNMRCETLDGQEVDSKGEKYIADYLFEHNISYKCQPRIILNKYERADFGLKCQVYCPDFLVSIDNKFFYWEHWALTSLDEVNKNNPINDPERYLRGINIKKNFMKKRKYNLIETKSIDTISKEKFEKILDNIFIKNIGYVPEKLSKDEIISKIKKYYKKTKLEQTFEYFINQVDNRLIDIDSIEEKAKYCSCGIQNFVQIGIQIYKEYIKLKNTPDFNDLIKNATLKIENNFNSCILNESGDKLQNIKYIMIDEYQDFSTLFYKLVESIKLKNSNINIFCVGDNLQSIYSFAGANKNYFENFEKYFSKKSSIHSLVNNYRSKHELVQFTNQLAINKCRNISRCNKMNNGGEIYNIKVDETYIGQNIFIDVQKDTKDRIIAKYLKTIDFIIKNNLTKNILFLSRTNYLYDNELQKLFSENLYNKYKNIKFLTIHKAKGLEADIIVLLNANQGIIPMINSLSETQQIFGVSLKDILDEELRLLYVALTRAKEKIYILNESNSASEIIKSLNPKETYIFEGELKKYNIAYRKASDKAEWDEARTSKFNIECELANDIANLYGEKNSWDH